MTVNILLREPDRLFMRLRAVICPYGKNTTALNQTHDIIYSNEAGGEAAGNASSNAQGTRKATLPDIRDTLFPVFFCFQ